MLTILGDEMIDEKIERIARFKEGNKEFLLTGEVGGEWVAAIGNKSPYVAIGEIVTYGDDGVEFMVSGPSPSAALSALLVAITGGSTKDDPITTVKLRVTGFRGNPLRVVLSNGDEATISQMLIDSFASPSPFELHPDDVAVDRFAAAMKAKLAKKRKVGAGGWDDPSVCHIDYLTHLLSEQFHSRAALDLVDIGNFAMMIFNRGETASHGR